MSESRITNFTQSRDWNHQPDLPLQNNPFFKWPPEPAKLFSWYAKNWLTLSQVLIQFVLAILVYIFIFPSLGEMTDLQFGWIFKVWLTNIITITTFAGSMHLYLYRLRKQGDKLKYDPRDLARDNGIFTFRNQVYDNMFWTLVSGVTIWSFYQCLVFYAAANGLAPVFDFSSGFWDSVLPLIWFVLLFFLIPIWSSFHFYWIHRLLHWPPLYKRAHSLHHRNVNVGPWSGISMHPIEHSLYFTNFLIHFVIPSHPIHILFHAYFQTIGAVANHSGFESLLYKDKKQLQLADYFHQLHHRYFECNYGTMEMPWDEWFGSFHDGSDEATIETRARKRRMYRK